MEAIVRKRRKKGPKSPLEHSTEVILKLDRIEAELEMIKFTSIRNGNQTIYLKENLEALTQKLKKLGQLPNCL